MNMAPRGMIEPLDMDFDTAVKKAVSPVTKSTNPAKLKKEQANKPTSQQANKPTSQQANKPT